MDLKQYFDAYQFDSRRAEESLLGCCLDFFDNSFNNDLFSYDVFIIGVPEGRLSLGNESCDLAPDEIRSSLYGLYEGEWGLKILDLGNLRIGQTVEDTYSILEQLTTYLIESSGVLLVLGGGHDLITPIYKGHCAFGKPLNFASADAYLDFQDRDNSYHSRSFLSHLLESKESMLSNYNLFGYQTYLCNPSEVHLLNQMDFNLIRLGEVNSDLNEIEPYIRNTDHLSVDISVIKASANTYSSPNGMTAEGLCMMLRYAGLSNRVRSVLFSELNPHLDKNSQSAKVYSQAVWYFLEGLHLRKDDLLTENFSDLKLFYVHSELTELVFYKSLVSDKWWVNFSNQKPSAENLLPCSSLDYLKAVNGELSSRILKYIRFK
tara:strand:+ start:123 stop:1250 length:1128 start_codon:yes stop_codon:yes gene_type:complete